MRISASLSQDLGFLWSPDYESKGRGAVTALCCLGQGLELVGPACSGSLASHGRHLSPPEVAVSVRGCVPSLLCCAHTGWVLPAKQWIEIQVHCGEENKLGKEEPGTQSSSFPDVVQQRGTSMRCVWGVCLWVPDRGQEGYLWCFTLTLKAQKKYWHTKNTICTSGLICHVCYS